MKQGDFQKAWGGIASLSVALSVIWTEMQARGLPIEQLARWMSAAPATLAGMKGRKGAIAAGYDADLVVFDPEIAFTLKTEDLHYRHPVSPYLGERLQGRVEATFVRGHCVFEKGKFLGPPVGVEQAQVRELII